MSVCSSPSRTHLARCSGNRRDSTEQLSVTVRSYRRVFDVDSPHPPGGLVCAADPGAAGAHARLLRRHAARALVLDRLPLIGDMIGALVPTLRYVLIPGAVAALGSQLARDGAQRAPLRADWRSARPDPRYA